QAVVRARKAELEKNKELQNGSPKRADLIQLLIDASESLEESGEEDDKGEQLLKNLSKTLTEDEIVAQAIVFLAAGFETSSASLTFALFELVNNADVQEKLYEEVKG